jgi:hypothetical protein
MAPENCSWAVGDLTAWEGIKRCGGAMHMGHHAAINIHQHMMGHHVLMDIDRRVMAHMHCTTTALDTFPRSEVSYPFPSVMGLALGKTAVSYIPSEGTREGEDLMKSLFGCPR